MRRLRLQSAAHFWSRPSSLRRCAPALARFSTTPLCDQVALTNLFYRAAASIVLTGCVLASVWVDHAALDHVRRRTHNHARRLRLRGAVRNVPSPTKTCWVARLSKSALGITGATAVMWFAAPAWCAVAWLSISAAVALTLFGRGALPTDGRRWRCYRAAAFVRFWHLPHRLRSRWPRLLRTMGGSCGCRRNTRHVAVRCIRRRRRFDAAVDRHVV